MECDFMCDDGVSRSLNIAAEVTVAFGCVYQQRVTTPEGDGVALGVAADKIYVLLDERLQSLIATGFTRDDVTSGRLRTIPDMPVVVSPDDSHRVKHTVFCGRRVAIVTQDHNGPCPVLAATNALALLGRIELCDAQCRRVKAAQLRRMLLDYMVEGRGEVPRFTSPHKRVVNDAEVLTLAGMVGEQLEEVRAKLSCNGSGYEMMERLYHGMNVSPSFFGVDAFEPETDVMVFALSGLRVVHGWYIREDNPFAALREMSFNEVSLVATKSDSPLSVVAQDFLVSTKSQMTEDGLVMLRRDLCEGEVVVLFWNNHFSTVVKLNDRLLLLLSDEIYADKSSVVFESIEDVHGGATFTDGDGRDADKFLLVVQSLMGNDFSEEDIEAAKEALAKELGVEPSPRGVADYLKAKKKGEPCVADGKKDKWPPWVTSGANQLREMGFEIQFDVACELVSKQGSLDAALNKLCSE
uniref:MINDY deubiquitinase domain-containing protein n=1 Tax=Trypanosoma congolense (strain IL3000) TaxID=1068625 RepID=G0UP15_TRYCI|nr:conserved hypothetical protein [Trypanosoma congolense IL3000]